MNILNILNYSPEFGGGIAKLLLALGKESKLNGHKLFIGFPERREWQNELSLHSEIIIIPEIKSASVFKFSKIIHNICKTHSIDILHLHFKFALAFSLACSFKKCTIPVIFHWHNIPKVLNEFLTPQRKFQNKLKRISLRIVASFTDSRIINYHISISREITELLTKNKWTDPEKIIFLPNGITKNNLQSNRSKLGLKKVPVIGTVANFRPQKDYETLLNAFSILDKSGVKSELWIIGDGPNRNSVEKLANELGISSSIRFLGIVQNPAEVYNNFDIFVLSTHFEGHPLVLLEAMSHGLPIIATAVSSIMEVITHQENGLLVKHQDAKDLASAFQILLDDESLNSKLRQASSETFQLQISIDDWANKLIAIYEQLQK